MPKATVGKQNCSPVRKHEVRDPRNVPAMQSESKAASVQSPSQGQLGRRILGLDASHHLAALVTRNDVNHRQLSVLPLQIQQAT